MKNSDTIKTFKKKCGTRVLRKRVDDEIFIGYGALKKVRKIGNKYTLRCIQTLNINKDLYRKIEQTLLEKYDKEISDLGISKFIFKNPNIKIEDMKIETTIDEKKVISITALADIDEIVNIDGKDYYYNMLVPFSITKIGIDDSTDCPSYE